MPKATHDLIRDPISTRLHRMADIAETTSDPAAGEALHGAIAAIRTMLDMKLPESPHSERDRRVWRAGYDAARIDTGALIFDAFGLGSRPGGATIPGVGSSRDYDPADLVAMVDAADLSSVGRDRRAALAAAADSTERLKAAAVSAIDDGRSEAEVARQAGVDRMTVRAWLGK